MKNNFAHNLKLLRKKRKWTQQYVSEQIGCRRQTIRDYELKLQEPRMNMLLALSKLFKISLDTLIVKKQVNIR